MMSSRFSVKKRARQSRVVRAAVTVVPCLCGWLNAACGPAWLRQVWNDGAVATSSAPIRSRNRKKTQARSLSIPAAPSCSGGA